MQAVNRANEEEDEDMLLLSALSAALDKPKSFRDALNLAARRRRRGVIRRGALMHPKRSAFMNLFLSKQDDALITLCGFDHASFGMLLELFEPLFDSTTPFSKNGFVMTKSDAKKGRPRSINATICLGLCLAWTRTRGSLMVLSLIFGMTESNISVWNRCARRLVVKILLDHPLARVALPTENELDAFKRAISTKYPVLQNKWAAMDGLKLRFEMTRDDDMQNNFYNGWTHDHYINSLFLFSPDGKVRACYLNCPGTMHDSQMALWGQVYDKIQSVYDDSGLRVVADSAFAREMRNSILASYQTNLDRNRRVRQNSQLHLAATSLRQMSEWGMRGFQASFPRLRDALHYEERGERKVILQMIVLLYNFRASTVCQNQIQSSFMSALNTDANEYLF